MKILTSVATASALAATMFFADPATVLQTGTLSVGQAHANAYEDFENDGEGIEIVRLVKLPDNCVAIDGEQFSCGSLNYEKVVEGNDVFFINTGKHG